MAILAFESGGTKLMAGIADDSGKLFQIKKTLRRPEQTASETLKELCALGSELQEEVKASIEVVGYGFGGPVSRVTGRPVRSYSETGWEDVDLSATLQRHFSVPVFVENDCNAAALGEALYGAGRAARTVFYMTLGTGCGGGVAHQGRILQLGEQGEAEIGHLVLDSNGPACACGNYGCLEAFCSGPAIARRARQLYGDLFPDAQSVIQEFVKHNPVAVTLMEEFCWRLGQGIAMVSTLFNPDVIVLGGGISTAGEPLAELVRYHVRRYVFAPFKNRAQIVISKLGESAVCQGAAAYARQRLKEGKN
ncbi:MAG TPA: ROK family protein [Acidobacteriota bacterium]|jgi:glucokinase